MPNSPARLEAYERIRNVALVRVMAFFKSHQDLLNDERIDLDIQDTLDALREIFAVLDDYVISKKVT